MSRKSFGVSIAIVGAALTLTGCMGAARRGIRGMAGDEHAQHASIADEVKAAQEKAITKAAGGTPDSVIAWAESKSGLGGTLIWDATVKMTYDCRRFHQTLALGTQVLSGTLIACPQGDGNWKVFPMPSS